MSHNLHTQHFPVSDLVKVTEPDAPVILRSGGPIMDVVYVNEGKALCQWGGNLEWFPVVVLYKLTPYQQESK